MRPVVSLRTGQQPCSDEYDQNFGEGDVQKFLQVGQPLGAQVVEKFTWSKPSQSKQFFSR
jgi:hypothetical protein